MRARISPIYDAIIEAGWLIGLVVTPLFFNVYSSRVFEPDKIGLLRSIALFMIAAWVAKLIDLRARDRRQAVGTSKSGSWLERLLGVPMAVPTVLLAVVYVCATITSIVPRVSLLGSYQRLQGTYTLLSYLVFFCMLLQGLRRREQLQRLITTIIATSLAPSLYGLVQHYGIDPLPWGGDVTFRVASNMGNAIFIGAYLILPVPLTVARLVQLLSSRDDEATSGVGGWFIAFFVALGLLQLFVWSSLGFGRGLLVSLLCILATLMVALYRRQRPSRYLLLGIYSLILVVQLLTLLFSQSRGPMLGILSGFFFFGLLYTFVRRWSWATLGLAVLAALMVIALVLVNLPHSPLAGVRDLPYVGRLGRVFEIEGGTGKVRVLIWEGVVDMLTDNPTRAVIGYGPEAMYVAYNPYYPPDLAHYEARNASPDRSHNETFDALVVTGVLGFLVYMYLFSSIFSYALGSLGLLELRWHKLVYWGCAVGGALLGLIVPYAIERSWRFAGVGLPVGYMAGLSLFLAVSAAAHMRGTDRTPRRADMRSVLMIGLVAAIVAHFVEIHFGIAVVATRLYFWTCVGLLVVVGERWVTLGDSEPDDEVPVAQGAQPASQGKRKRRRSRPVERRPLLDVDLSAHLVLAVLVGLVLIVLGWDYTTNATGAKTAGKILADSLTTLAASRKPDQESFGLLWLMLASAAAMALAGVAEMALAKKETDAKWWLRAVAVSLGGGLLIGLIYGFSHAAHLKPGVDIATLIYGIVGWLLALWVLMAAAMALGERRLQRNRPSVGAWVGVVLAICCVFVGDALNIRPVKADTLYKQGLKYDQEGVWDNAIYFYQQAIDLTPKEDFYYLFIGRAYMEKAKSEENPQLQSAFYQRALQSLVTARGINPLNTDHTANMARLYRSWAETESDPEIRGQLFQTSLAYYAEAVQLSPNNAQLYNEWGLVHFLMGDYALAEQRYEQSLALDQQFLQTYLLFADIYWTQQEWPKAIANYEQVVTLNPDLLQGWSALGYAYSQAGEYDKALEANLRVLQSAPDDYGTLKNVAILYNEREEVAKAVEYAQRALAVAPEAERATLETFLAQMAPSE